MNENFITIIVSKPAKAGDDYKFSIPRKMIRQKVIDPAKHYELRIYDFDEAK